MKQPHEITRFTLPVDAARVVARLAEAANMPVRVYLQQLIYMANARALSEDGQ
jgi:hypothetical protein